MKTIEILGAGCAKCQKLYEYTRQAVQNLGIDAVVSKVEDMETILDYGVMMTPAMVIDGEVKVKGKLLNPDQIEELLS